MEETHCCKATIEVVQAPLSSRHTQWKEVQVLLEAMEMLEGFIEEIRQKPSVPRSSSSMHEQLQPTSPADSCSDGITENSLVKAMEDDQLLILEGGASITKNLSDQIDAENETRKLFVELTQLVDEDLDADSLLQSQEETIFEQDVGDSEYEALKMFDKSTEPIFTGSKSISGKCYPFSTIAEVDFSSPNTGIQQMNKAEELFPSKLVVVKAAYRMFDEMPKPISIKTECLSTGHHLFDEMPILFSVKENDKSKGREKLGLQVAELSRVLSFKEDASETSKFTFDPDGSFESNVEKKTPDKFSGNALKIGSGINVMRKSHYEPVLPTRDVMNQGNMFAHAPILALGETLDNRRVYMRNVLNGMLMFVFDPGGSSWLHNGCDSFGFTDDKQHFDKFSENYSQNELGRGWQVAWAD